MDQAPKDAVETEQGGHPVDKRGRNGLHDPSYQQGGARGAEKGDGLNGDDGPDTGATRDVGRGAD